jgi:hypothetical protein
MIQTQRSHTGDSAGWKWITEGIGAHTRPGVRLVVLRLSGKWRSRLGLRGRWKLVSQRACAGGQARHQHQCQDNFRLAK